LNFAVFAVTLVGKKFLKTFSILQSSGVENPFNQTLPEAACYLKKGAVQWLTKD
jgi:hypothetical protein